MTFSLKDYSNVVPDEYSSRLFQAVEEGMYPFRFKRLDVYAEYDIDHHEYRVLAEVVLMSNFRYAYVERIGARDLSDYPDREMLRVAEAFLESFRNREDWALPALVQLGDN